MPILFVVVARGTTVLAKYASCAGNFTEVTEQILAKISSDKPKLTYAHGSYLFHYSTEKGLTYLCITDDEFERSRAFLFLNEVQKRFFASFGVRAQTALPYAMNSEFSVVLANQMKHFSENKEVDRFSKVQDQLDDLKEVMVQNIDSVTSRGEKIDLLVDKTDLLSSSSVQFKKSSRTLARAMLLKNIKITVIIVVVVILILYFIISAACGGLAWQSCVK